jgi:hypothetical protein
LNNEIVKKKYQFRKLAKEKRDSNKKNKDQI